MLTMLTLLLSIMMTQGVLPATSPQDAGVDGQDARPATDFALEKRKPETAEDLLDRLEEDAETLEGLSGTIRVDKLEFLTGDVLQYIGTVHYRIDPQDGAKQFAVLFNRKGTNDEFRDREEWWIFDGMWLVEKNFAEKAFIKRQIVRPGETFDPLRLGEGPFPLPIAQKKADVLERFDVRLIDVPQDEGLIAKVKKPEDVYGLELTPRPGTPEAEEYRKVHVFYDRETLLPEAVDAFKTNDNRDTVILSRQVRNPDVDESVFDTSIPPADEEWRIDVREWDELPRDDE